MKKNLQVSAILIMFSNNLIFGQSLVSNWTYVQVDSTKSKWGDFDSPNWLRYFGLDMGDLNSDGFVDILTGRNVYLNPGGMMTSSWGKLDLGKNVDGLLVLDVDKYLDIIAQALPDIYWFELESAMVGTWTSRKIGNVPATSHVNSQGFIAGQLIKGGKEEFVIDGNGDLYLFEIPSKPVEEAWRSTLIAENTSDEGIGLGDINGDGNLDIVAGRKSDGQEEPLIIVWYENPGQVLSGWNNYKIGRTNHAADRIGVADINGDGKPDVVVTEERWPGLEPDANLFWFEQGEDHTSRSWDRHRIVTQYSMNNLEVKDMDMDGDSDILTSEHKGPNLELQLWHNDGSGNFKKEIIDKGKEGHLGTQVIDLDLDGDLDIDSIGWDHYQFVHVWRNESISSSTRKWKRVTSETGDLKVPNSGNQQTSALTADIDNDGDQDFFISERTAAPSLTMYRYREGSWKQYIIEDKALRIEAGSAAYDIDGDGDLDILGKPYTWQAPLLNIWINEGANTK